MHPADREALRRGAEELSIPLDEVALDRFELLATRLYETNARYNLTAIPPDRFVQRHALESFHPLWALDHDWSGPVVDIGSGPGFPGLPVAIAFPSTAVTLVESRERPVAFLRSIVQEMGLEQVTVMQARAERLAHAPEHRERYGLALCRAVGPLLLVAELMTGFLCPGGHAVPHRTKEEVEADKEPLGDLGLVQEGTRSVGDLYYPVWRKGAFIPATLPRPWNRLRRLYRAIS